MCVWCWWVGVGISGLVLRACVCVCWCVCVCVLVCVRVRTCACGMWVGVRAFFEPVGLIGIVPMVSLQVYEASFLGTRELVAAKV